MEMLTKIETQIATLERELAVLPRTGAAKQRKALQARHELLVRQVQWATMGATKPGQVL